MAYEALYGFPEKIKAEYEKYERIKNQALRDNDKKKYVAYGTRQYTLIDCLVMYYDTALSHAKFKHQRSVCKQVIDDLKSRK